jgi:hypothetical protein
LFFPTFSLGCCLHKIFSIKVCPAGAICKVFGLFFMFAAIMCRFG